MSFGTVTDAEFKPRRRWYEDPRPLVYVAIETKIDGGDVRRNALRSIAACALDADGDEIASFAVNLAPPEGATADPRMLQRYRNHGDAWLSITSEPQRPSVGVQGFVDWVQGLPGQPVAVGTPLAQAVLWLETYFRRYTKHAFHRGHSEDLAVFAGGGIDLPTLVMGVTGLEYRKAVEHLLPADWREGRIETHRARDDARMHASLLATMLRMRATRR